MAQMGYQQAAVFSPGMQYQTAGMPTAVFMPTAMQGQPQMCAYTIPTSTAMSSDGSVTYTTAPYPGAAQ